MINGTSEMPPSVTGAEFANVTFSTVKGFSRAGYDPREVDAFLEDSAYAVDRLNDRLAKAEQQLQAAGQQIQQLREQIDRDSRSNHVEQAINILTTAQITADKTVADADNYSATVMTEAREFDDATRRNAAILEQETEAKALAVYDDALHRVADLERANEDRLAELTLSASIAQQELDSQTVYLRTLRDATRLQMEVFLEGLLDHLAEEYGRAHPIAAGAVTASENSTESDAQRSVVGVAAEKRDQRPAGPTIAPIQESPSRTSGDTTPATSGALAETARSLMAAPPTGDPAVE